MGRRGEGRGRRGKGIFRKFLFFSFFLARSSVAICLNDLSSCLSLLLVILSVVFCIGGALFLRVMTDLIGRRREGRGRRDKFGSFHTSALFAPSPQLFSVSLVPCLAAWLRVRGFLHSCCVRSFRVVDHVAEVTVDSNPSTNFVGLTFVAKAFSFLFFILGSTHSFFFFFLLSFCSIPPNELSSHCPPRPPSATDGRRLRQPAEAVIGRRPMGVPRRKPSQGIRLGGGEAGWGGEKPRTKRHSFGKRKPQT